ncbi:hypothetical protein ACG33_00910 [Steroidobacter denitrificans]|uniref:Transmembrane protein n=1 Tax=Steroidobacter denitrificans TaxID=465721 RepID=A0A127F7W4_STEDE|nr:hypothetical protein [Steroidobacter denitrificans]AMN45688.1 hypothetical protein ACG33_00910 [Steroidobacter denitrificans]
MSHSTEKHMPESTPDDSAVPFEPPLTELQRAIQWRAQAANDADRERESEARRPKPLKWLITFILALVPVVMIFGALDAFLRVYYRLIDTYLVTQPGVEFQPEQTDSPPQPGIVLLQPYDVQTPATSSSRGVEPDQASQPDRVRQQESMTPHLDTLEQAPK